MMKDDGIVVAVGLAGLGFLTWVPGGANAGDWNQWRGPDRNGVSTDETELAEAWPEDGPVKVWESETLPSDHYGGHGSAVVSDGKVYMSLIWHRDVPTETRSIDNRVMSDLGNRGNDFSPELKAAAEKARVERPTRLRGAALNEWAKEWVAEHLNESQQMRVGSWLASRLVKGKAVLSFEDYEKLDAVRNKRFESFEAMVEWLDGQGFSEEAKEKIIAAVPSTRLAAEDVVICWDAETGEELWKAAFESEETSRKASSTPAVVDGKVLAVSRDSLYSLDAETGDLLWKSPLPMIGPASCPLVVDGKVIFQAEALVAYSFESGEKVWEQKEVRGSNSSPTFWEVGGQRLIVANGKDGAVLVDGKDGAVVANLRGGGEASPVVSGDYLVVYGGGEDGGLYGYRWDEGAGEAVELWGHDWRSRRKHSTPIIYEGHVYLAGGDKQLCVNLETGEKAWEELRRVNISSPFLADGKIYTLQNNGGTLTMFAASPEGYEELGSAKVGALSCPSPAIADGRVYLRLKDRLACFDLREG
ncbi:MAG: PQQ-binding-like beta-propeller repeat protein [Verrucomicrobiota bacterium]